MICFLQHHNMFRTCLLLPQLDYSNCISIVFHINKCIWCDNINYAMLLNFFDAKALLAGIIFNRFYWSLGISLTGDRQVICKWVLPDLFNSSYVYPFLYQGKNFTLSESTNSSIIRQFLKYYAIKEYPHYSKCATFFTSILKYQILQNFL